MITLSVQVRNAKLVKKALEDLNAEIPKISAGRIWGRLNAAKARMKQYPPVKPWSKYRRTRNYARGWDIQKNPSGGDVIVSYSFINRVQYARLVGGGANRDGQAWMHMGWWPLTRDVLDDKLSALPKEISQLITVAARRRGL